MTEWFLWAQCTFFDWLGLVRLVEVCFNTYSSFFAMNNWSNLIKSRFEFKHSSWNLMNIDRNRRINHRKFVQSFWHIKFEESFSWLAYWSNFQPFRHYVACSHPLNTILSMVRANKKYCQQSVLNLTTWLFAKQLQLTKDQS